MSASAPKWLLFGTQSSLVTKPTPSWRSAGHAFAVVLHAMNPRTTSTNSPLMRVTARNVRSPHRVRLPSRDANTPSTAVVVMRRESAPSPDLQLAELGDRLLGERCRQRRVVDVRRDRLPGRQHEVQIR